MPRYTIIGYEISGAAPPSDRRGPGRCPACPALQSLAAGTCRNSTPYHAMWLPICVRAVGAAPFPRSCGRRRTGPSAWRARGNVSTGTVGCQLVFDVGEATCLAVQVAVARRPGIEISDRLAVLNNGVPVTAQELSGIDGGVST